MYTYICILIYIYICVCIAQQGNIRCIPLFIYAYQCGSIWYEYKRMWKGIYVPRCSVLTKVLCTLLNTLCSHHRKSSVLTLNKGLRAHPI